MDWVVAALAFAAGVLCGVFIMCALALGSSSDQEFTYHPGAIKPADSNEYYALCCLLESQKDPLVRRAIHARISELHVQFGALHD